MSLLQWLFFEWRLFIFKEINLRAYLQPIFSFVHAQYFQMSIYLTKQQVVQSEITKNSLPLPWPNTSYQYFFPLFHWILFCSAAGKAKTNEEGITFQICWVIASGFSNVFSFGRWGGSVGAAKMEKYQCITHLIQDASVMQSVLMQ